MFREKIIRNIPLIPSFFFLICVSLAFGTKSLLMPKRSTYIVYMDKFLMPKAFSGHHYWYSSVIDSFKFTNLESPHTRLSSPLLSYTNDNALHGFGAVLSLDELETLNKSLGFISACADKPFKLATTIAQNSSPLKPPLVYGLPQIMAKTL